MRRLPTAMIRAAMTLALTMLALMIGAPLSSVPAVALESAPVSSKRAIATLVTETDAMQPGTPFRVGLRLRMTDGWHTYWKNPGDAGVPPELKLEGGTQSAIDWPTPRRIAEGSVMTYSYTGEVLLPVTVNRPSGVLKAHAEWLVCKDICVPEEGDFTLTLPVGTAGTSAQAKLFAAHDRAVPRASPWTSRISADGILFVQGPELSAATVTDAWFIPEQSGQIQDDAAQPLSVRGGGFTLALKPAKGFDAMAPLAGVLSVRDRTGLQTDVVISAQPGLTPAPPTPPLGQILVFAFLGGLVLNLMPCVFPILAMKAVALARHAGDGRGHAVSYTAGVLVTFMALAGALLVARAAGAAAGWGFQFSSPVFVAAMTWLLFAVGLNLSGVFEVGGGTGRHRQRAGPTAGCCRQFLHRVAGGPGGDALHRAVHGRGGCRGAGRAPGGDHAGVRGHGPRFGRALCRAGLDAGAGPADAATRALDGDAAAGAGVPDVWRRGLAGLGAQSGGGTERGAGRGDGVGAGGVCGVGLRRHSGLAVAAAADWAGDGGCRRAGRAGCAVRSYRRTGGGDGRVLGRSILTGAACGATGREQAGVREHDRGLVRHLPGQ